jgi:hypothetical protein
VIEVVTAADPDLSLTLLATVKDRLGIADGANDAVLTSNIKGASEAMIHKTGFVWPRQEYRERLHGTGALEIQLSRRPLDTISEFKLGDEVLSSGDYSIINKPQAVVFREVGWPSQRYQVEGISGWPLPTEMGRTKRNLEIKYTAGYITPAMSGIRSLPYDVEEICIEICTIAWQNKSALPLREVETPNLRVLLDRDSAVKISDATFAKLDYWNTLT